MNSRLLSDSVGDKPRFLGLKGGARVWAVDFGDCWVIVLQEEGKNRLQSPLCGGCREDGTCEGGCMVEVEAQMELHSAEEQEAMVKAWEEERKGRVAEYAARMILPL